VHVRRVCDITLSCMCTEKFGSVNERRRYKSLSILSPTLNRSASDAVSHYTDVTLWVGVRWGEKEEQSHTYLKQWLY